MKKIIKNPIFTFIIGILLTGGVTGVIAYSYNAKDVSYEPSDENWNVNSVEGAIGSLYTKSKTYQKLDQTTTATVSDIANGKTAYDNNGNLITGTHVNGSDCVNGSIVCSGCTTSTGQRIINFIPKYFVMWIASLSETFCYNPTVSTEYVAGYNGNNTVNISYSSIFMNKSDGLYLYNKNSNAANKTIYYMACK